MRVSGNVVFFASLKLRSEQVAPFDNRKCQVLSLKQRQTPQKSRRIELALPCSRVLSLPAFESCQERAVDRVWCSGPGRRRIGLAACRRDQPGPCRPADLSVLKILHLSKHRRLASLPSPSDYPMDVAQHHLTGARRKDSPGSARIAPEHALDGRLRAQARARRPMSRSQSGDV